MLREQLQHERDAAARLAGELEAARRIQMGILPKPAELAGNGGRFALHAFIEPARTVLLSEDPATCNRIASFNASAGKCEYFFCKNARNQSVMTTSRRSRSISPPY